MRTTAFSVGTSPRIASTLGHISEPGYSPSATSTFVFAPFMMSLICEGSSIGLIGFMMPAASAPQTVKWVCGRLGRMYVTTSRGPTPRSWNKLADCVIRPTNSRYVTSTGVSHISPDMRKWMAIVSGFSRAPFFMSSYVLFVVTLSSRGTDSMALMSPMLRKMTLSIFHIPRFIILCRPSLSRKRSYPMTCVTRSQDATRESKKRDRSKDIPTTNYVARQ